MDFSLYNSLDTSTSKTKAFSLGTSPAYSTIPYNLVLDQPGQSYVAYSLLQTLALSFHRSVFRYASTILYIDILDQLSQ